MNVKKIILSLDVSTSCIGCTLLLVENKIDKPKILEITHIVPKINSKIKGTEALLLKKNIFENEFLLTLKDKGITDVIIEEPLLSSNNVNTVATLLRFNGMISEAIYRNLGIVPIYLSSYNSRRFSFPDLLSIRTQNKKGEKLSNSVIKKSLKDKNVTLFGAYQWDIDKKVVMMDKVNEMYPDIDWIYNPKNEIKKENFDACDALVCGLAYINLYNNDFNEDVDITNIIEVDKNTITYELHIWDKVYNKVIILE